MAEPKQDDAQGENPNLAQLREKAERADAAEARALAAEKRLAFTDAGISTKEGTPGALLYENFQPGEGGEITSAAVLEAAQRFGITPGVESGTSEGETQQQGENKTEGEGMKQGASAEERAFFDQSRKAAGGEGGDGGSVDPNEAGYQAFNDRISNGGTRQDAAAAGMAEMFKGASEGDGRVLYDQKEWRERNS